MLVSPTIAAILLPARGVESAEAWLGDALRQHGYLRRDTAPPPGVPMSQDEWLGFVLAARREGSLVVALLEDPSAVFRVATWLSAHRTDAHLAAWRRYMGGEPVLKIFLGGRPRWKDGDDPDHEVAFDVPRTRPADLDDPVDVGLPAGAAAVEAFAGSALRPYREAVRATRPGERAVAWLRADSPLAL